MQTFQETVWSYYRDFGRDLPWRQPNLEPYNILVSEVMLQQTQVSRVLPKYHQFLNEFPTALALAQAPLGKVLQTWSGLGYNRRAKYLWQAAQKLERLGVFPQTQIELMGLPGVGANTAAAILVYAFNQPLPFIETNIRTVYIHHYFHDQTDINDKDLLPLVTETLDQENPREWFWALMDYGSYLKAEIGNLNQQSKHYLKQSNFKGSRRQLRGELLRRLARPHSLKQLQQVITDERLQAVLEELWQEGLVMKKGYNYQLPD